MVTLATRQSGEAAGPAAEMPPASASASPLPEAFWASPVQVTYASRTAARRCRVGAGPAGLRSDGFPSSRPRPAPPAGVRSESGSSRRDRWLGRARRVSARTFAALGLGLLLAGSIAVGLGYRGLVVMSGSMEPAVPTGSLVVVKRIPAEQIEVGEVISFRSPEFSGQTITHRVQAVSAGGGRVEVETRGDANTGSEEWVIDPAGTVGRFELRVPGLGYLLAPLQGRAARLLLVAGPAVLLAVLLVAGIWRPAPGRLRKGKRVAPSSAGSGRL